MHTFFSYKTEENITESYIYLEATGSDFKKNSTRQWRVQFQLQKSTSLPSLHKNNQMTFLISSK